MTWRERAAYMSLLLLVLAVMTLLPYLAGK